MVVKTTVEASTTAGDMGPSNMIAMAGSRAATAAIRCMTAGALPLQPPSKICRAAGSAGRPTIRQHAFV
ncbi:hypothetical protein BGP82_28760 [Pseudomonas putida]|jgi:hypothetical protein|uniref:Uncharacterized protein n=1 Tax=Pseudomonas putida TaxID=303 RepID=A0A1L7NP75_PSEPU|nr:hypothetical protein L483_16100 [Pseudomonas putida H8234]KYC15695.1 hypothetical protein WM94_25410 [Pseudomonas sp. ABFPK]POF84801.1 hypothetical protein BGP83_21410 [Pseudomonas putida]POF85115.1 hypothetical protein BGP81_22300 [Pseudomonas putida]POF99823.1 hypothetical protein BGP82_28760 [Pseudomonas putida]